MNKCECKRNRNYSKILLVCEQRKLSAVNLFSLECCLRWWKINDHARYQTKASHRRSVVGQPEVDKFSSELERANKAIIHLKLYICLLVFGVYHRIYLPHPYQKQTENHPWVHRCIKTTMCTLYCQPIDLQSQPRKSLSSLQRELQILTRFQTTQWLIWKWEKDINPNEVKEGGNLEGLELQRVWNNKPCTAVKSARWSD